MCHHSQRPPSRSTSTLALALALWLAGCATSPDNAPPPAIAAPAAWSSAAAEEGTPQPWLSDFASPQLEALVTEAMRQNAELQQALARLEQSVAEAGIRGADQLPAADLGLNGARQKINTFGPTATGGVIFENYELNFNLSWELDLWGRLRNLTSAALARVELSQAELAAARLSLAGQVTKAWLNWIEARQLLQETEQTAAAYRENRRTLESRFQRGLSDGLDLRRIRNLAAGAEADRLTRRRSLDAAARELEVLLGRYPAGKFMTGATLPELPAKVPAGLPAQLIERRPDLVAAERRLAAADREWLASRKELLPRISLTTSGGTSSREFDDLLNGDFEVWSLAGNLAQPIFQGGRIRANIDRTASLREQARANYLNTALQAYLEVETTLAAEPFLREQGRHLATAAEEANAAERLAWDRYRRGASDFLEVLDAQRTAASARTRLIQARKLFLQNRIDLYLALGGPFEAPDEDQANPDT